MGGTIPQRNDYINPTASNSAAIGLAAAPYKTAAELAGNTQDLLIRTKQAKDETELASKKMEYERKVYERYDEFKRQRAENPAGAAQTFDDELKTLASEYRFNSDQIQTRWGLETDNFRNEIYRKSRAWEHEQQVITFGNKIEKSVNDLSTMAYRGDITAQEAKAKIENLSSAGSTFLDSTSLSEMKDKSLKSVTQSYIQGLAQRDPEAALQALNSKEYDSILGTNTIQSYTKTLSKIKENAQGLADLSIKIKNGDKLQDISEKQLNKTQINKLAKQYYDFEIAPALSEKNPEGIQKTISYVKSFDKIPPETKSFINQAYNSSDFSTRTYAYDLVNNLKEESPELFPATGNSQMRKYSVEAEHYQQLLRAGLGENEITSILNNTYKSQNDLVIKERKAQANKLIKNAELPDTDEFDSQITFFDASYPEDMMQSNYIQNLYKGLVKDNYILSGDEEVAKSEATKLMKNLVGVSRATGRATVMEYPPEKYYVSKYDTSGEWIKSQLENEVKNLGYSIDDVMLVSDELTRDEVEQGLKPTYSVFYSKEGQTKNLGRFEPDIKSFEQKQREQKKSEAEQDYIDKEGEVRYFFNKMSKVLRDANNQ